MIGLQLSVFRDRNQLVDPIGLRRNLAELKAATVDGVMVECCWGLVENESPHQYDWSGYVKLFQIVRESELKLQVQNTSTKKSRLTLCPTDINSILILTGSYVFP
jgi:hypothetical protein